MLLEGERGQGGRAVVFPSPKLDPEPEAAVKVHWRGSWAPLIDSARLPDPMARLAELQSDALKRANASLKPDGTLHSP